VLGSNVGIRIANPQNVNPQNADPQNADPQNVDIRIADPQNVDKKNRKCILHLTPSDSLPQGLGAPR
jgi:hypothetical protein